MKTMYQKFNDKIKINNMKSNLDTVLQRLYSSFILYEKDKVEQFFKDKNITFEQFLNYSDNPAEALIHFIGRGPLSVHNFVDTNKKLIYSELITITPIVGYFISVEYEDENIYLLPVKSNDYEYVQIRSDDEDFMDLIYDDIECEPELYGIPERLYFFKKFIKQKYLSELKKYLIEFYKNKPQEFKSLLISEKKRIDLIEDDIEKYTRNKYLKFLVETYSQFEINEA